MWSLWWEQLFLLLPKHSKGFGSCPKCAQQILTCATGVPAPPKGTHVCGTDPHIWLVSLHLIGRIWEQSKRNSGSGGCQLLNEHFLILSLKLKRWEICKNADKDNIWCLLNLPVKSLSFAIFARGSRNIRPDKEILFAAQGRVLVKVSWCFLLYSHVFSCLWLFITLHSGIKFFSAFLLPLIAGNLQSNQRSSSEQPRQGILSWQLHLLSGGLLRLHFWQDLRLKFVHGVAFISGTIEKKYIHKIIKIKKVAAGQTSYIPHGLGDGTACLELLDIP